MNDEASEEKVKDLALGVENSLAVHDTNNISVYNLSSVTEVLETIKRSNQLTEKEKKERARVAEDVKSALGNIFPDEELKLEQNGSLASGLAHKKSDLNLSLTFKGRKIAQDLDIPDIIKKLGLYFSSNKSLYKVRVIELDRYSRYLPRLRFGHINSRLECELSLYDNIGSHASGLISTYAEIDDRCSLLAYAMKCLAKVCQINEPGGGSLSSYGYLMMVIYYLQRTQPPVLPVLHELHKREKPELIVDGCNVWFYENIQMMRDEGLFTCSTNKKSSAQLWIYMLKYYSEDFDYDNVVICISKKKTVLKSEKSWLDQNLAIEDPFDGNINVSSNLSVEMSQHIKKVFHEAWKKFISTPSLNLHHPTMMDYYYDYNFLNNELPKVVVKCRSCKSEGHVDEACPDINADGRERKIERIILPPKPPPSPDQPGQFLFNSSSYRGQYRGNFFRGRRSFLQQPRDGEGHQDGLRPYRGYRGDRQYRGGMPGRPRGRWSAPRSYEANRPRRTEQ